LKNPELYKHGSVNKKKTLNRIYVSGTTQAEWNCAMVLPIYKRRYMKDPNNYKGIKLLKSSYKIYKIVLNKK